MAFTCAVLIALSKTSENSPIPNAGASTTKTVDSVSGSLEGLGSVVSSRIMGFLDVVNPLAVLTIIFFDTSTCPWKTSTIVSPVSPSVNSCSFGSHSFMSTTLAIFAHISILTLLK